MEEAIANSLSESATNWNTAERSQSALVTSPNGELQPEAAVADFPKPIEHAGVEFSAEHASSVGFTVNTVGTAPLLVPRPVSVEFPSATPQTKPETTPRVSLVIPAKNEEKNLPALLTRLPEWLHEVILVNGVSNDATDEVARRHLESIRIVAQKGRGKGDALREGFAHCTGDIIIAIDADGSMDPDEIRTFATVVESGFDYVKGSRMIAGGSSTDLTSFRRFGNWFFRTLTNRLHRSRYSDLCYGYFGFRRGTIDRLDLRSDGFEIETEISIKAHQAGLRTTEVPSAEFPRTSGKSNLRAIRDGWRILWTILRTALPH